MNQFGSLGLYLAFRHPVWSVIPAQAGIQIGTKRNAALSWTPAFAGVTRDWN
jgi:hypothetical protein